MTDGVSRRELIVMAGSSAVLASQPRCRTESDCPDDSRKELHARGGLDDHWGADPSLKPTYQTSVGTHGYDPKFIAIAIINFTKRWTVDIHHASFPLNPSDNKDPNYRRQLAVDLISWTIKNGRKLGSLPAQGDSAKDRTPYKRRIGPHSGKTQIDSFDAFKFKSQNELFIFLKHPNIEINKSRLIRFTRYSFNARPMDMNYSFFNARLVDGIDLDDLGRYGRLIRVENHMTNCDESPIVESTEYSMNILFGVRSRSGTGDHAWLPMIIDPETGNGTGHEP